MLNNTDSSRLGGHEGLWGRNKISLIAATTTETAEGRAIPGKSTSDAISVTTILTTASSPAVVPAESVLRFRGYNTTDDVAGSKHGISFSFHSFLD